METALFSYGNIGHPPRAHERTTDAGTDTQALCLSQRCGGLALRATILAFGLLLGGAGPVLGAGEDPGDRLLVRTNLGVTASKAAAPRWRYRDAWGAGSDRLAPLKPEEVDEYTLEDAITRPLVWSEWRASSRGREQALGIGLLHPGARPAIMKEAAQSLELRVYLTY